MDSLSRRTRDMLGSNAMDWFSRPYIADWIVVGIIYALGWLASGIPPYEREFSHKDETLNHTHHRNQIGGAFNRVTAQLIPLAVVVTVGLIRRSALDIHHGVIAEISGWSLAHLVTECLKNTVGRLRPDFLARCKWDKALKACTGDIDEVLDGRRSFPSGHSSGAFAGMTFLALWIAGSTGAWCFHHTTPGRAFRTTRTGRFALSISPFFWSTYVAVTRLEDYRHHKEDVIVGALIGIASAMICYHIFFPSPFSLESLYDGPRVLYTDEDEYPQRQPQRDNFVLAELEEQV